MFQAKTYRSKPIKRKTGQPGTSYGWQEGDENGNPSRRKHVLQGELSKAKQTAEGQRLRNVNEDLLKDEEEKVKDYKINGGLSIKISTKQLLIWAAEIYDTDSQSVLAEKILVNGLTKLLDRAGFDWEKSLEEEGFDTKKF